MSSNEQSNFCEIVVVLPGCFCSHVCAFDRLIAPMRSIKPPVRFANPIYYVHACKKRMMPFEGQPRKWKLVRRFPRLEVRLSSIPNAGFGLFVAEDVKAGQPIATYRRKIVSEAMARRRYRTFMIKYHLILDLVDSSGICLLTFSSRAIDTFGRTMQPAAAWIRNPLHRRKSSPSALLKMLLV